VRRTIILLSATLLVLSGLVPSSQADQTVTVREYPIDTVHDDFALKCDGSGIANFGLPPFRRIESANPSPTLGERSWGFGLREVTGRFVGPGIHASGVADLANYSLEVSGPSASGRAAVVAAPDGTVAGTWWLGLATLPLSDAEWTTIDGAALTYTWTLVNQPDVDGNLSPAGDTSPDATIAGFVAAEGDGPMDVFMGLGCDGENYHYDALKYGAAGNITTLDYEALNFHGTLTPSSSTLTAGQAATLHVEASVADEQTTAENTYQLQAKPYGASTWSVVPGFDIVPIGPEGANLAVKPLKQTSYRIYFEGIDSVLEGYTPVATVNVRAALTLGLVDSTLSKGDPLVVKGVSKPKKPGVRVTLWRKTTLGNLKLGSARVKANGSYRITTVARNVGRWTVFTTLPATPGNLAARSADKTFRVRR
jgi:hypothetical protein